VFTGIVEDLGEITEIRHLADAATITIRSPRVTGDARAGDSIAISGVCLTVTGLLNGAFTADIMRETLDRSSLGGLSPGDRVNLERSVRVTDRLSGHLVQGHVDGTGLIASRSPAEHWEVLRVTLPPGLARYVVRKGSVAVDGVSLTVSALGGEDRGDDAGGGPWFEVSLIPETLKRTTLGTKQPGQKVNLEVDVIAKYVEKLLGEAR
jgi:riboflavin synthase